MYQILCNQRSHDTRGFPFQVCDIGDASSGSLSSYAHVLLMFHYLQHTTPPVIPVLQQVVSHTLTSHTYSSCSPSLSLKIQLFFKKFLQLPVKGRPEEPIINGWNCYYYRFDDPSKLVSCKLYTLYISHLNTIERSLDGMG